MSLIASSTLNELLLKHYKFYKSSYHNQEIFTKCLVKADLGALFEYFYVAEEIRIASLAIQNYSFAYEVFNFIFNLKTYAADLTVWHNLIGFIRNCALHRSDFNCNKPDEAKAMKLLRQSFSQTRFFYLYKIYLEKLGILPLLQDYKDKKETVSQIPQRLEEIDCYRTFSEDIDENNLFSMEFSLNDDLKKDKMKNLKNPLASSTVMRPTATAVPDAIYTFNKIPAKENIHTEDLTHLPGYSAIKLKDSCKNPDNIITKNELQRKVNKGKRYKIYTKKYDQIIYADDILSKKALLKKKESDYKNHSAESDAALFYNHSPNHGSKGRHLARKLYIMQKSSQNDYGERLGGNLAEYIATKRSDLLYIKNSRFIDAKFLITILIDNSGSMRGKSIEAVIEAINIIGSVLVKYAIKFQIAGFTTLAWRGGNSYQDYLNECSAAKTDSRSDFKKSDFEKKNSPCSNMKTPGRLNDLLYIIYKEYHQNWTRVKNNLRLMKKEGILKENIDGEALLWSVKKALKFNCLHHHALLVISDGHPAEDITLALNGKDYLNDHLHYAINKIRSFKNIKLMAFGIDCDLSHFYKNSIMLKNDDHLADSLLKKLAGMLHKAFHH